MMFSNFHTTNLETVSIHTGTDEHGNPWTLITTVEGSDIVVGPNGGHIDTYLSTAPAVAEFLAWVIDEVYAWTNDAQPDPTSR